MIYVSREQVAHVKYLLEQAMLGNHILFEPKVLKAALLDPRLKDWTREQLQEEYEVEGHIEKIMTLETIPLKKAYLERLPGDTFAAVVKTYVSIVENTLQSAQDVKH